MKTLKISCNLCHSDIGHYNCCPKLPEDLEKALQKQKEQFRVETLARNIGYKILKEISYF